MDADFKLDGIRQDKGYWEYSVISLALLKGIIGI